MIRVRDNGIGLAAEHARAGVRDVLAGATALRPRRRAAWASAWRSCRGLVEMHGGRIEAHSAGPRAGSRVRRASAAAAAADAARAVAAPAEPAASPRPRRVLVADDNADALDSLALLLSMQGHEVHTARCGAEALAAAHRLHPDVAVLDIGMPELNGYEVASQIRREPWGARRRADRADRVGAGERPGASARRRLRQALHEAGGRRAAAAAVRSRRGVKNDPHAPLVAAPRGGLLLRTGGAGSAQGAWSYLLASVVGDFPAGANA